MDYSYVNALIATLLIFSIFEANAQISTPCTSSMLSTFTPCLSYVTRSSGTGASPTEECCNSLKSLTLESMDCACLIMTGNVPVSLSSIPFINRQLAISLPRICGTSVPVQCKASGVPLPSPGPALFGPNAAPAPNSRSPQASKAATVAAPPTDDQSLDLSPESPSDIPLGPSANPGIRPVVNPNSASNLSNLSLQSVVVMLIGISALKFF